MTCSDRVAANSALTDTDRNHVRQAGKGKVVDATLRAGWMLVLAMGIGYLFFLKPSN